MLEFARPSRHPSMPMRTSEMFPYNQFRPETQYATAEELRTESYIPRPIEHTSSRIYSLGPDYAATTIPKMPSSAGLRTPPPEATAGHCTSLVHHNSYYPAKQPHPSNYQQQVERSSIPNIFNSSSLTYRDEDHQHHHHHHHSASYSNGSTSTKRKRVSPPTSRRGSVVQEEQKTRRSSSCTSMSLTVPRAINGSKGNLAEFASQITCLFWFESSFVLHRVAESKQTPVPTAPLVNDAVPGVGFKKWVTTILGTTQVSQNVVILALLFIYRLKKLNPTVKGKPGSEFRLFTVALMLGNKFLDDNTYTNKTWAEVSGITVGEIHVMEVEFLSNMRYSLYTSEEAWMEWQAKLGRFGDYWERAQRAPIEVAPRPSGPVTPSLATTGSAAPLPSPPPSNSASPPLFSAAQSPSSILPPPLPHSGLSAHGHELGHNPRKRSIIEDSAMQPPSKRLSRTAATMMLPQFPATLAAPTASPNAYLARTATTPSTAPATKASTPPAVLQPQYTPFPVQSKAPTNMYAQNNWGSQGNSQSGSVTVPAVTHNINITPFAHPHSRHNSPYIHHHHSNNSSPTGGYNSHLSPSLILTHRDSPYRPVRTVSTLLVPPPPSAEPHALGYDQMQYQPLAKARSEFKTGLVPYSTPTEIWPAANWMLPAHVQPK